MRITDGRIDKLYPVLTAKERALLVLRAWKQDEEEDRRVRLTMPDSQISEFNRLLDLMNGCYLFTPYIGALGLVIGQLSLRYGWLLMLDLWAIHAFTLADYIWSETKEPITENDYQRRVEAARAEMAPGVELAELLAEMHEGWGESDLKKTDDGGESVVTAAAWKRVSKAKERELGSLVGEGVLEGKWKGKRLLINVGSFYDWLGEEMPVLPDWGRDFDILPDSRAEEVERNLQARQRAREAVVRGPSFVGLLRRGSSRDGDGGGGYDRVREGAERIRVVLEGRLREEVPVWWQTLNAVEKIIDELASEFDGEDPLQPTARDALRDARARLEKLVEEIGERLGPLKLEEPPDELLSTLRRFVGLRPGG